MPSITVKITNLGAIKRAFGLAPQDMIRELNNAIQKSIFTIERDSKQKTPVDTGRLRSSHLATFQPLRGVLQPRINYAIFVHQGTRYMKGRPFLFDAVNANERNVQKFFADAVQKVLDKLARGF